MLAGLDESPGERVLYQGRTFKAYRGMGSLGAMVQGLERTLPHKPGRRKRTNGKLVPEGVEGRVPFKGPLSPFLYQLVGGLAGRHGLLRRQNDR